MPTSSIATTSHSLHRSRRNAVNPYFSKKRIAGFSSYIQEAVNKLCWRLLQEHKGTGKPVSLNEAYSAITTDIIFHYTFAYDHDFLSYPDFVAPFTRSIKGMLAGIHVMQHFQWLRKLLQSLPDAVVCKLNPTMIPVVDFFNVSDLSRLASGPRMNCIFQGFEGSI